jgi:putative ABC transport system permease protein
MSNGLSSFPSLAFRNLVRRKSRTALTVTGIVLGVAVVLAVSVTNASTLASIHRIFDEGAGRAELTVISSSVSDAAFQGSALGRASRVAGVSQVAPVVTHRTLLAADADSWGLSMSVAGTSTTNDLLLFGVDPAIDRSVRDYSIVSGSFLPGDRRAYAAVLVEDYARDKKLVVGKDLIILTPDGEESLRIVGLIKKEGVGLQNGGAVAVVPMGAVQALYGLGSDLTQIDVLAQADVAGSPYRLEELKGRLATTLGDGYQVLYPAARGRVVSQMLASYQLGLNFFRAVALFVGAFLIYNTFTMTVVERTREIGMLRTLGATQTQVASLVLLEAGVLGGIGSLLGSVFGIVLARGLSHTMASVAATQIAQLDIPPSGLLTSMLLGLGVTLVSASLPAWRARNVSPLEALRASARPQTVPLGQFGWVIGSTLIVLAYMALYHLPLRPEAEYPVGTASVFGMLLGATLVVPITIDAAEHLLRPVLAAVYGHEGWLGAGNMRRSKGRTTLTVGALMVGIAMIIGVQAMTTSFEADIAHWVETAIGGDLYIRSPIAMRLEFGQRLLSDPVTQAITPLTFRHVRHTLHGQGSEGGDTILFTAIDPLTYPQVASFVFEDSAADASAALAQLAAGDALLVSATLADRYHLSTGDTLSLETRRGEHTFRVAGVVTDFSSQGYVVNGSRQDLQRYFGDDSVSEFIMTLRPGVDVQAEATRIKDHYGKGHAIVVETATAFRQKVMALTSQAFALFDVLGLIGVVIAALGVVNTLMMNIAERQREIGGLRSLGMTKGQIARMVLAESGAMGMVGGAFGMVFGFVLSKVLLLGAQRLGGFVVHYYFPPAALLISLAIALGVSQLAALYPARRAANVRVIEAIQHE